MLFLLGLCVPRLAASLYDLTHGVEKDQTSFPTPSRKAGYGPVRVSVVYSILFSKPKEHTR